jgi:hypothetical protein
MQSPSILCHIGFSKQINKRMSLNDGQKAKLCAASCGAYFFFLPLNAGGLPCFPSPLKGEDQGGG